MVKITIKKREEVQKPRREPASSRQVKLTPIVPLADLDDNKFYELYCYAVGRFGTEFRPWQGSEMKLMWRSLMDYGRVGITSRAMALPENCYLVQLPDSSPGGEFVAIRDYEGQGIAKYIPRQFRGRKLKLRFRSRTITIRFKKKVSYAVGLRSKKH